MAQRTTYLFSGGGTGGHLFPGISVAMELQRRDPSARIVFVGSSREIEAAIVAQYGLEHRVLPVEPLPELRRHPFRFLWRNLTASLMARQLLRDLMPATVIGLGGFASAPVVWQAHRQRIPVILLEQNAIAGRTNRWLSRFADAICVSVPDSADQLRRCREVIMTGCPVRPEIAAIATRTENATNETQSRVLLILGGSQGADSLNAAVIAAVETRRDTITGWEVFHQAGPRQVESLRRAYEEYGIPAVVEPFFQEISTLYTRATIVISRAGAATLAELACAGRPMILLPFPFAADNHQEANARQFVDRGAAEIVMHDRDPAVTAAKLSGVLDELIRDPQRCQRMGAVTQQFAHPNAAELVASRIRNGRTPLPPSSLTRHPDQLASENPDPTE